MRNRRDTSWLGFFIFATIIAFIFNGILMITLKVTGNLTESKYNNSVEVTVTKFDYDSKYDVYETDIDIDDTRRLDYTIYYNVDCIIKFSEETEGYTEYEYTFDEVTSDEFSATKVGDTYTMYYNDLEHPSFFNKEIYKIVNIISKITTAAIIIILIILLIGRRNRKRNRTNYTGMDMYR